MTSASSMPSSNASSQPATPQLDSAQGEEIERNAFGKTKSTVNLTKSTLFGIYEPTSFDQPSQPQTPWGTGAETPQHRGSLDGYPSPRGGVFKESDLEERLLRGGLTKDGINRRPTSPGSTYAHHVPQSAAANTLKTFLSSIILFGFGLAYGALIAHLHDDRNVAPVKMEGLKRDGWRYLAFWGTASVMMGLLLPWIDTKWVEAEISTPPSADATTIPQTSVLNAVEWNDVVRSVGAFVGIAFAIRKTPWSSPLQLSATLTLVNPFLWYLLDRTATGLTLSCASGFSGVLGILLINPTWVPSPSHTLLSHPNSTLYENLQYGVPETLGSFLSHDRVGLAIWIGSVFFCSCICFGNIGRLLVPRR